MQWNEASAALTETQLPANYRLCRMQAGDVSVVTARLAQWYPDIRVGMESPHLQDAFYFEHASLEGYPETVLLPLVIRHSEDGVVAVITYEKNSLSRTITSRLGVLSPEHRASGLALLGPMLLERIGRAIGAELAYYFATLKTRHQQVLAERSGYTLVGIVPAYDRDMIRPGEIKRVYEAIYAKVLIDRAELAEPDVDSFTAQTRAVWNALFGAISER
jgi:hypothetical protein